MSFMQIEEAEDYAGLVVGDSSERIIIIQAGGQGKTLSAESIAEELHAKGVLIIFITDVKGEFESCYSLFEPMARWHLNALKKEGKKPNKKKGIIYHPFTSHIPKTLLPELNIYTLPMLDALKRDNIMFLAQPKKNDETDSIKLVLNALEDMTPNSNIYDLMDLIGRRATTQQRNIHGRDIVERDSDMFFMKTHQKGSVTNVGEIGGWLKPYLKNYFLTPSNFSLNLDVKKLLADQEHYHYHVNKWLPDEKIKDFSEMAFFGAILKGIEDGHAKYPVCFIIEEVQYKMPLYAEGYKTYLADYYGKHLITMRSKGRGCGAILTAQGLGFNPRIREKGSKILIGQIVGISELDQLGKQLKLERDDIQEIKTLDKMRYFLYGKEDQGAFKIFVPSHAHAEEKYNFFEMYKRFYPEKMKKYTEILDMVKAHIKEIHQGYAEKSKAERKREVHDAEEAEKRKSGAEMMEKRLEEVKEDFKDFKADSREEKIQKCWELKKSDPTLSVRDIAKIVGLGKSMVADYIKRGEALEKAPKIEGKKEGIDLTKEE